MNRHSTEYQLAERIVQLEKALDLANSLLKKNNFLGVIPDISVRFKDSQKFHKKVRTVLEDNER